MPAGPRHLGPRLRRIGLDQPVRRGGEAALEPRVGGPVVALRGDDRAERQGPLDGRWLARPERRDRARGVRARAADERPLRVPQHRRQEDVDVEGPRRGGAHDRRGRPARAAPLPVPAPAPEPGDRVRSGRNGRRAAPVRRVRPVRGGHRRPRGEGRDPARVRGDVPLRAPRPEGGRRGRGVGLPPGVRPPRSARPGPGRRPGRADRGGEGDPVDRARAGDPRRAGRGLACLAGGVRAGRARASPSSATALPAAAAELDDAQRRFLAALSSAAEGETPAGGDAWQALIFSLAKDDDLPARRAFEAIYVAFLGRPNGPRAGWLLASLEPSFVTERARAAGATPPGAAS